MEYKDNWDVFNNGTEKEKKIVLESFMYFVKDYHPHRGLVDEFLQKKPRTNRYGDIVL